MKKGRKSKTKDKLTLKQNGTIILTLEILNLLDKKKLGKIEQTGSIFEDQFDQSNSLKMMNGSVNNFLMMIDSENVSMEDPGRNYTKRGSEKIFDKYFDTPSLNSLGPITRRKEHMIMQLSGKNQNEKSISELNTLQKFDDYYKERRRLDNEVYFYHPPRISHETYQITIENYDKKINSGSNNKTLNNFDNLGKNTGTIYSNIVENYCKGPIYDFSKISKDDLNYYLKFIDFYKDTYSQSVPGNVILKGAHSFESNAINLLKECDYDVNSAMKKILFPVLDLLGDDGANLGEGNI